jgi:hypothetical protein
MALRRRAAALLVALPALSLSGLPFATESVAFAQAPPPAKAPPPAPAGGKKADVEYDPDAKPKEAPPPPPLPPPEPGQWGVGGKEEEEGKFAPAAQKKKEEEARKAREAEEEGKPVDLGPARHAWLDTVVGFGAMRYLIGDTGGDANRTTATGASFVFGFSWRVADIWTLGIRYPFTRASVNGPAGAYNTFASGNVELNVSPSFKLTRKLRLPAQLSIFLPTGQGDSFPDITTSDQKVAIAQAQMNQASTAARGWEDMALFAPRRFGLRLGAGITWDSDAMHVTAGTKLDLMMKVSGGDAYTGYQLAGATYAWVTHASFHYGFLEGKLEPGLKAWLAVAKLPVSTPSRDDGGAQFVLEPQVNGRFPIGAEKAMAVKAGLGFVLPVAGPIGGGNGPQFNAAMKGLRINAQFEF